VTTSGESGSNMCDMLTLVVLKTYVKSSRCAAPECKRKAKVVQIKNGKSKILRLRFQRREHRLESAMFVLLVFPILLRKPTVTCTGRAPDNGRVVSMATPFTEKMTLLPQQNVCLASAIQNCCDNLQQQYKLLQQSLQLSP